MRRVGSRSPSTSTGRSAGRNARIAISTAMSASAIEEARWTRALLADLERQAELAPDREVGLDLFRRRHAVADAARDRRGADRARAARCGRSRPISKSRSRPIPNSAEAERFAGFAAAGVNRLSLGVQALDPRRRCGFSAAVTTATRRSPRSRLARDIFPRYSFDLIYARPGQSVAAWEARARRGADAGRRASVALSADDRARHRLWQPRRARRDR